MAPRRSLRSDWYTLSADTLRHALGVVLALASLAGGWWGFDFWQRNNLEQRATQLVASSRSLVQQLRRQQDIDRHQSTFDQAKAFLGQAEQALSGGDFATAAQVGEESFDLLSNLLEQVRNRGQAGIAWFVNVEGNVQYRRGETGPFVNAHARDFLYEGDYVRSSGGASAEIYFHYDDTRFTLRPNTFFKVSGGRDTAGGLGIMEYGWVDLDTSRSTSGVKTRWSEVTVSSNSEASISLEESGKAEVRVGTGRATVRAGPTVRELHERQQVAQDRDTLGAVTALPATPRLLAPEDNQSIDIDTSPTIQLRWGRVEKAVRYALQVSRSRLFGSTLIDTSSRTSTAATLGLSEQGSYVWRVAAIDARGGWSPWSEPRRFRVSSSRGLMIERDETPPPLEVEVVMSAHIAVLSGQSEPGARVEMDGRPLPVNADGKFSTSENVPGTGFVVLTFRAIDASGNVTEAKRRVRLPD